MKLAFLCPGQGSQKVGMGKDLYKQSGLAKSYFDSANAILGVDIQHIMFNGPEDTLKQTQYTQPALYIVSVIIGTLLKEQGITPECMAGHSLGEYSAFALSGAFDYETGLHLVNARAKSMQEAGERQPGTMAAIIGLGENSIIKITETIPGTVVAANFNSPGQVVISGEIHAVNLAMESAKESGARLVKQLNVSGAFHSPLMNFARVPLAKVINSVEIQDSIIPVYSNVSAKPIMKKEDIKSAMINQLESPVRWNQTIMNMVSDGITHCIEVGTGRVLQGISKRIDRSIQTSGVENWEQIQNA